uniref:Angiotensin-converting enzyme n=1 Tax=Anopheles maculatus TaxID=74869 RepID=A0A182SJF9_9DIPT
MIRVIVRTNLMVPSLLLLIAFGAATVATDPELERSELTAQRYVIDLEEEILARNNNATELSWAYESNITEEALKRRNEAASRNANFFKVRAVVSFERERGKVLLANGSVVVSRTRVQYQERSVWKYLNSIESATLQRTYDETVASWDYESNITEYTADISMKVALNNAVFWKVLIAALKTRKLARELRLYDFNSFKDADLKRRIKKLTDLGYAALDEAKFSQLVDAISRMQENYATAKVCQYRNESNCNFGLEPELTETLAKSRDPDELKYYWMQWHEVAGKPVRKDFDEYVALNREAAQLNNFTSGAEYWLDAYEDDSFEQQVDAAIEQIRPLYEQIHGYVRYKLRNTFWEKSILEKPNDGRELVCHASAWDFYKKDDVRIKQCTRINMEDFFTVHHELGHIQYYLQYQHLPSVYREGANPGFHEAVGDVLSLSVSTPKHLEKIGLLKDFVLDEESKLNQFYQAGLSKLVFLPFAYTLDKYRWEIFRGDVKPEHYNCKFWEMRSKYSGLEPPVERSETDFDAAAKYHVSADVEYLRYFVSYIVQFQFHRAACEKAGEYVKGDPEKTLNNCDIYQSAEAGNALKAMLAMGSSKPWPDAMEVLTGQRKMSADALIEYFKPLYDWLVKENKALGAFVGWEEKLKCKSS